MGRAIGSETIVAIGQRPNKNTPATNFTRLGRTTIDSFGNSDTFTEDSTVNTYLQPFKGQLTDRTSNAAVGTNFKIGQALILLESITRAVTKNKEINELDVSAISSTTGYAIGTVNSAMEDLLTANRLLWVDGAVSRANNGLKSIRTAVTAGSNKTIAVNETLTNETSTDARIYIGGVRLSSSATMAFSNLTDSAVLNSTGIGNDPAIHPGMDIIFGSYDSDGDIQNTFTNSSGQLIGGMGTVRSVSTNSLVIEQLSIELQGTLTLTGSLDLRFGVFSRPVPRLHPTDFLTNYYDISRIILGGSRANTNVYGYANQNILAALGLSVPSTGLVTLTPTFEGTVTENSTTERSGVTNVDARFTRAASSSGNIGRIIFANDLDGFSSNVASLDITISRDISRFNVPGIVGALDVIPFLTACNTSMDVTASDERIFEAVNDHADFAYKIVVTTRDGWFVFHVPAYTLTIDSENHPNDNVVTLSGTAGANVSTKYDTSFLISMGFGQAPIPRNLRT